MGQGKCYLCESNVQDRTISRHVDKCIKDKLTLKGAASKGKTFLLKVKDKYISGYFLYLLVDNCVTLEELDRYLRGIWLECCGHLSCFSIDGEVYDCDPKEAWEPVEGMDIEVGKLLYEGLVFVHEYDYGTTTYLELKVMHVYPYFGEKKGITLVARNLPPAGQDGHDSPRDGVCGYCSSSEDILFMEHEPTVQKPGKNSDGRKTPLAKSSVRKNAGVTDAVKGKKYEDGLYEKFKNADFDEKLGLLDKIFSSENPGSDGMRILADVMETLKNLAYSVKHEREPFTLKKDSLTDHTLYDMLKNLCKDELTAISKNLSMKKVSSLTKDKLAAAISEYIHANLHDILVHIPYNDFAMFGYLLENSDFRFDVDSELISEYDGRRIGIFFAIDESDGYLVYKVPLDIKKQAKKLLKSKEFIAIRKFANVLEQTIKGVLFYWGVVEKYGLLKEVSKQLGMKNNAAFQPVFIKMLKYLSGTSVQMQKVGIEEYYTVLAEDINAVVMSDTWKKSVYPELTEEMLEYSEYDMFGFMLDNIYFKEFYEDIKAHAAENGSDEDDGYYEDEDEYEDEEDFDEEDELFDEDLQSSVRTAADVYRWICNALPGTGAKDFFDKIKAESGSKELSPAPDKVELITKMLAHTPNVWLKGNAASGEVHAFSKGFKPYTVAEKPAAKNSSTSAKAAERWKVGRNDPCPCGSGKKYKKCCLKE